MSVSISLASNSSSHITPCLLRNIFSFYVPSFSFSLWSYFLCLYFISSFVLYTLSSMFFFPNFIRRIFFFHRLLIFVLQSPSIHFCLRVIHVFSFSTSFFTFLLPYLHIYSSIHTSMFILPFTALFTAISALSFPVPSFLSVLSSQDLPNL